MSDQAQTEQVPFFSTQAPIDVSAIMAKVEARIDEQKKSGVLKESEIEDICQMEMLPMPDFLDVPNVYEPHLYPPHPSPQFQAQIFVPEQENGQIKAIMAKVRKLFSPLLRFYIRPQLNEIRTLMVEFHNHNALQIHHLNQNTPITNQSKEYIKLLHNALNNMIVEFSKLKIEEEMLKTQLKTMEDRLAFLEKRERAIEKKVFPT